MTEPTRGARQRRSTRRPAWPLLTALLVLAIVASSALVFTNEVELLKLAVIIALWAAVVAAFISFIYRRQADVDQAKVRDLKLVYDLQLDREISARREYELSVESHLRRELSSELGAAAADEVAALRAELAALRANLQILFDTDLQDRPALETERPAGPTFGKVISSRIDAQRVEEPESDTDESPIIDVPEEPQPAGYGWTPPIPPGGAHRRASQLGSGENGWRPAEPPPPRPPTPSVGLPWLAPESVPTPTPAPAPPPPRPVPSPPPPQPEPTAGDWQPPVEPIVTTPASPAMAPPSTDSRRARHWTSEPEVAAPVRARHSASDVPDPGRPNPTLAAPPHVSAAPPAPEPAAPVTSTPAAPAAQPRRSRHRDADEPDTSGQHEGGQPLADLLARLQTGATSQGGGRRRRDD